MRSRTRKSKKKLVSNKIIFIVLIVILFFTATSLYRNIQKNKQINEEIEILRSQADTLQKNNIEMRELVEYFNSSAFIEERARIDLGLKKPGENVVIIPDIETSPFVAQKEQEKLLQIEQKQQSNILKWWQFLFK